MSRSVVVASALLAGIVSSASADFIVPDTGTYGWDRGSSAFSTYAEWDVFASPAGPNAPDVGSFVGGTLPGSAADFNVFDAGAPDSGSFITSGGNIYSFSGVVSPQIEFGGFGIGPGNFTTVLLQVRTLGNEVDMDTVRLNETIAPDEIVELDRVTLGGFGGVQVDTLFTFQLDGNLDSYTINFDALGSSMSLDRVALDTFTFVPAPGSAALLALGGVLASRRRRTA